MKLIEFFYFVYFSIKFFVRKNVDNLLTHPYKLYLMINPLVI